MKEPLTSMRLKVINSQIRGLNTEITSLSDSLVDKEFKESLEYIENIKLKLKLLKDQVINGNIIQKYTGV
jgi:hypothetical protein